MKELCLVFLVRDSKILLAPKKKASGGRDFLIGKLNGYGGVIKDGESPEEAVEREAKEEGREKENDGFGIKRDALKKVALIDFIFKGGSKSFKCHTFLAEEWEGEPKESEEMGKPEWFPVKKLPFRRMMPGDIKFLPIILSGRRIRASVYLNKDGSKLRSIIWNEIIF